MKAIPLGLRATLLLPVVLSAISCERLPTTADQAAPSRPSFVVVPGGGSWTTKAPMPTARAELGVAAVNGILYAVGGSDYPAFPILATASSCCNSCSHAGSAAMLAARCNAACSSGSA